MIRVGERGEGKFKRASWDEALDYRRREDDRAQADRTARPRCSIRAMPARPTACCTSRTRSRACSAVSSACSAAAPIPGRCPRTRARRSVRAGPSAPSRTATRTTPSPTRKLMIMWGWNPAYTFHGGNTFYYMRMAKQRGCKFVLVDPQYTDSAAAYDAWWIPIKPNTDAAMMAGDGPLHLHQQPAGSGVHRSLLSGHGCRDHAATGPGAERQGELQGLHSRHLRRPRRRRPEWAEQICGVSAEDIRKLARHVRHAPSRRRSRPPGRRAATPTASSTTAWPPRCRR